jgi:hypothetical protein
MRPGADLDWTQVSKAPNIPHYHLFHDPLTFNVLKMFHENVPQSSSPQQQRNRKLAPLPKRSRYGRNAPPSQSPGEASGNLGDCSSVPTTPRTITMKSHRVNQTGVITGSSTGHTPQNNNLQVEETPLTPRSLHNASPQPPMMFAKPLASSLTSQPSLTPNTSNSATGDQTAGLQQTLRNLSLEEMGNPASSFMAEATISEPYNINKEPAPNEPFYSPLFQSTLKTGIKIASDAADGTTKLQGVVSNQRLRNLQEDAELLKNYQSSGTRTIAVLGDSGQGEWTLWALKSSLSLLTGHL